MSLRLISKRDFQIEILIISFLIPYFYPDYWQNIFILLKLKQVLTYLAIGYLIMTAIYQKIHIRDYMSVPVVLILTGHFWQLICSLKNGISISYDLHNLLWEFVFLILFSYLANKYKVLMIKACSNYFLFLICINSMTVVFWTNYSILPEKNYYFLGYRYSFCIITLAALMFNICYCIESGKRIFSVRVFLVIFFTIITVFVIGPSTLVSGLIVMAICYMIAQNKLVGKKITSPIVCFIVAVMIQFYIVGGNSNRFVQFIVENILGRSMTFTGRSSIWIAAIQSFLVSDRIFGWGNPLAVNQDGWVKAWWDPSRYVTAHNQFLQTMISAGIMGLTIEILTIVYILILVYKKESGNKRILFTAGLFSMFVMMTSTIMVPTAYKEAVFLLISFSIKWDSDRSEKGLSDR